MKKPSGKKEISPEEIEEDDIVLEPLEETSADALKKLRKKLAAANKQSAEYLEGWQRSKADFINAKKEQEVRMKTVSAFTEQDLMLDILPAIDSFDMAMGNKEVWESVDKNWRTGIEYIHTQLLSILGERGLKILDPLGEQFDVRFHTAFSETEGVPKKEDGKILEVIQKGYVVGDRVLRPAQVRVGRYVVKTE